VTTLQNVLQVEWLVLCAFHLKITLTITLVFPAIRTAFSVELLHCEHCINPIDSTNNPTMLILLFRCSVIPLQVLLFPTQHNIELIFSLYLTIHQKISQDIQVINLREVNDFLLLWCLPWTVHVSAHHYHFLWGKCTPLHRAGTKTYYILKIINFIRK